MNLLKTAQRNKDKRQIKINDEAESLALAWVRKQISLTDAKIALKVKNNCGVYSIFARVLARYIRKLEE